MDQRNDHVRYLLGVVGGMLEDASAIAIAGEGLPLVDRLDRTAAACRDALALIDDARASLAGGR